MLSTRTKTILNSIVGQYITRAIPVPSQSILDDCGLNVSSATIRNDMAHLEQEGYITRPHTSAGGIPSDKGYRHYVESIGTVELPLAEQRKVSHLFHQVETALDEWLHLAVTIIAQMVQNSAVVTLPRPKACQFKHLELVSLQDSVALVIIVLSGANVRQQLITFGQNMSQEKLSALAIKLRTIYSHLTASQIRSKEIELSPEEQQITDCLVSVMEGQDGQKYEQHYLDGLHFTLSQPEFAHGQKSLALMELIEERNLLKRIIPSKRPKEALQVIIGKENESEVIQDYSLVISEYGLSGEASGTICVLGPTRMPYARTIATVNYLSLVLSLLMAKLYGQPAHDRSNLEAID